MAHPLRVIIELLERLVEALPLELPAVIKEIAKIVPDVSRLERDACELLSRNDAGVASDVLCLKCRVAQALVLSVISELSSVLSELVRRDHVSTSLASKVLGLAASLSSLAEESPDVAWRQLVDLVRLLKEIIA